MAQPNHLIPNGEAQLRGCNTGGPDNIETTRPQWVSVDPNDNPVVAEGLIRNSMVSHEDFPYVHNSHDQNFDVKLDPAYEYLLSDANKIVNNERLMEMEWEINNFPPLFWPSVGDRVWMIGRWVFDCGHPPCATEIHPPSAVAFSRNEPTIFSADSTPSLASSTYIYIHGHGGYYDTSVAGHDYAFDVRLPPKPSSTAQLRTDVQNLYFDAINAPKPILTPDLTNNLIHVLYPLSSINSSPDLKFGAHIAAGWHESPLTSGYHHLQITFDSIRINNVHNLLDGHAKWHLWAAAGGHWIEIPGLDQVHNGDTINIGQSVQVLVPDNGQLAIQTTGWTTGRIDGIFRVIQWGGTDLASEARDYATAAADIARGTLGASRPQANFPIGMIDTTYFSNNNFGISNSQHDDLSMQYREIETQNDFNLRYHISEVARFAPGT